MKSLKDPQFCSRQPLYSSPMQPGNTGLHPRFACGTMPLWLLQPMARVTASRKWAPDPAPFVESKCSIKNWDALFLRMVLGLWNSMCFSLGQNYCSIKTCNRLLQIKGVFHLCQGGSMYVPPARRSARNSAKWKNMLEIPSCRTHFPGWAAWSITCVGGRPGDVWRACALGRKHLQVLHPKPFQLRRTFSPRGKSWAQFLHFLRWTNLSSFRRGGRVPDTWQSVLSPGWWSRRLLHHPVLPKHWGRGERWWSSSLILSKLNIVERQPLFLMILLD